MKFFIKQKIAWIANNFFYHFIPKKIVEDIAIETATEELQQYSSDPKTSALWSRLGIEYDLDLTIIIPVYNVEKYLGRCMDSVLHQKTKYSYDVIAINDCSSDNSADIINNYKNHPLLKIINHKCNQGVSAARNNGLQVARGKYVMFLDSDDFLEENAVENLMESAFHNNADIVQGGYYHIKSDTEKLLGCTSYKACDAVPPNGVIAGMVCGKVYISKLFNRVCFPEKYWFEDTIVTALLTHLAEKIVTIPEIVYYYRQNPAGNTRTSKEKPKAIDTLWVHRCVMDARKELGLETDVNFYEHLLRMTILSYQRTVNAPEQVKKSLFILFGEMLKSARKNDFLVSKHYANLEKAIMEKDYNRYSFLCKFI